MGRRNVGGRGESKNGRCLEYENVSYHFWSLFGHLMILSFFPLIASICHGTTPAGNDFEDSCVNFDKNVVEAFEGFLQQVFSESDGASSGGLADFLGLQLQKNVLRARWR
jgi:hypothetical protein